MPAGSPKYRSFARELCQPFSHATSRRLLAPASIVSKPTGRTTYMYQRRSVAEAPDSPTEARSRAAMTKWKAQIATNTRATQPAWEVASQSAFAPQ